jgi:hypothetical protein
MKNWIQLLLAVDDGGGSSSNSSNNNGGLLHHVTYSYHRWRTASTTQGWAQVSLPCGDRSFFILLGMMPRQTIQKHRYEWLRISMSCYTSVAWDSQVTVALEAACFVSNAPQSMPQELLQQLLPRSISEVRVFGSWAQHFAPCVTAECIVLCRWALCVYRHRQTWVPLDLNETPLLVSCLPPVRVRRSYLSSHWLRNDSCSVGPTTCDVVCGFSCSDSVFCQTEVDRIWPMFPPSSQLTNAQGTVRICCRTRIYIGCERNRDMS